LLLWKDIKEEKGFGISPLWGGGGRFQGVQASLAAEVSDKGKGRLHWSKTRPKAATGMGTISNDTVEFNGGK